MFIGSCRPADLTFSEHSLKALKQDLLVHHLCREIALFQLVCRNHRISVGFWGCQQISQQTSRQASSLAFSVVGQIVLSVAALRRRGHSFPASSSMTA
jgi:hypothetical protein